MMPDLQKMTKNDVEGVAVLEAACFSLPWSKDTVSGLVTSPYDETWVLKASLPAGENTCVSLKDAAVIGYITFRISDDPAELMRIAVAPGYRRRGYSKILMDRMIGSVSDRGIRDISLEVRTSNTAAISLYASFGFREETLRKGYYTDPKEDAVIMFKRG